MKRDLVRDLTIKNHSLYVHKSTHLANINIWKFALKLVNLIITSDLHRGSWCRCRFKVVKGRAGGARYWSNGGCNAGNVACAIERDVRESRCGTVKVNFIASCRREE